MPQFDLFPKLVSRTIERECPNPSLSHPCLVWQGAVNSSGYGVVRDGPRLVLVHRVIAVARYGPLPGMDVHHRCGVRRCWQPEHLEPVPYLEHRRGTLWVWGQVASG